MTWLKGLSPGRKKKRPSKRPQRLCQPVVETLEDRRLMAFSVVQSQVDSMGTLRLIADFNQPVNAATVQASDLVIDCSTKATAVNVIDADTVEFLLPSLAASTHSATIAAGAIQNSLGQKVDRFTKSFVVADPALSSDKPVTAAVLGDAKSRDAAFAGRITAAAASVSLTTAFQTLRSTAIWPVTGTTFNEIESAFGPRIKVSTSGYDWHRGIDIDAPEFTPVVAPMDGTLFDIKNYTDGGLTVILKHTFPDPVVFAGKTLTSYYTFYMHLSSVDPSLQAAATAGSTPAVSKGFQIGKVGHSGTAVGDHLHWEIRVGTPYSLEWQLANPTSQYGANNFGFDPHVNPMLLTIPTTTNTLGASLTTKPTSSIDGRVRITTDDEQTLFNRVQVTIVNKSTKLTVASHTLDLNERLGFNATTNALLDTPDKTKPYIAPISFGTSATVWATDLVIPKSWVGSRSGTKFLTTVTLTDIWGRTKTISW